MKPVVGAVAQDDGQLTVCALVEVVTQLVVDGNEVLGRRIDAHLDPDVLLEVDVPRARMTYHLAVPRLGQQRPLPERLRQLLESEGREEALAELRHLDRRDAARLQDVAERHAPGAAGRGDEVVDVAPVLRPDVAEQVRRNRTICRDGITVLRVQPRPHVGVQRQVQRPQLSPQPVQLLPESVWRHVVPGAPHDAVVGEANLLRALVHQLGEPHVVLLHGRRDRVPAFPYLAQALRVATLRQDLRHRLDVEAGIRGLRPRRAVLAAAVRRLERGAQACHLGGLAASAGAAIVIVFFSTES